MNEKDAWRPQFEERSITIDVEGAQQFVKALVLGVWAYHKPISDPKSRWWRITHVPSGFAASSRNNEHNARALCIRLHIRGEKQLNSWVLEAKTGEYLETLRRFIGWVEQESLRDRPTLLPDRLDIQDGPTLTGRSLALLDLLSGMGVECDVDYGSLEHGLLLEHDKKPYPGSHTARAYARVLGSWVHTP